MLLGAGAAFLVPTLIYVGTGVAESMPVGEALGAAAEQWTSERQNLMMTGVLGLFPVLCLAVVLWIHRRMGGEAARRRYLAAGGLIPILLVLIWVNISFWSVYLPARTNPGFPHGLELVIGPGMFAPVAMLLGVGLAWFLTRPA